MKTIIANAAAARSTARLRWLTARSGATHVLTKRQQQIVELVMQGMSNKEIARKLDISLITVRETLHKITTGLGISNRTQLAMWAVEKLK